MSDLGNYPHDPAIPLEPTYRRPRPARTFAGNTRDDATTLPLQPGLTPQWEQVTIGQPPALTENEIERVITVAFQEAKQYDDRLQIARAAALRLYNGEPLGDEEVGRSQIVMTEVKDTIQAMMPTLMRVFTGSEKPVEFRPVRDGDEEIARQAEDYTQHVCFVENDGWRVVHDSILDGMQLKVGWIHWWWDYKTQVRTEHYYTLLEQQLSALVTEPGVTALRVVRRFATPQEKAGVMASPEAKQMQLNPQLSLLVYDAQISRKSPKNRPRICAIPSEQVLIDTDATGPHDPMLRFIGRWRIVTVSDLVALGFPRELVMQRVTQLQQQTNRVTRRRDRLAAIIPRQQSPDPSLWRVRYLECWARFDYDGDSIAELHHCHMIGDYSFLLLAHEPASHVPLARIAPYLVPHRAIGESMADRIGDIQRLMTRVYRNILDSMAESIHPRTVILDGMVPPDDVLNTEMGAVIRETQLNSVRELVKPFIGPAALPILETVGAVKEQRTGITKTSQGLTADVLQSTTPVAVSAQLAASADRLEMVVRTIAQGMRDVFEGIAALMVEHQDRPRSVLLRGVWTPVDPRAWLQSFHVVVKDAVGNGTMLQRIQILGNIATQQKELLTTMGPNNPLCTLGQLRNTLADMAECAGITNVGRYFNPLPTNYVYQPPPQPPGPDQIIANAQLLAAQSDSRIDQEKADTDRWTAVLEDDRLRDEGRAKYTLQAIEIAGKYGLSLDLVQLGRLMDRDASSRAALFLAAPPAPAQPPPGMAGAGGPPGPGASPGGGPPGAPGAPGAPPGAPPGVPAGIGPPVAPPPRPLIPPPGAAPPMGLAQRLYLPPNLINALSAANRLPSSALATRPGVGQGMIGP